MGCVNGVYYKDVMEDLHMPRSTFYLALGNLEEKGFIAVDWAADRKSFNLLVLENEFLSPSDFKGGYVNINLDFILSERFILLKVNLKKFFLRLLSLQANTKQVKILKDTLKRYKVNKYMKELSTLFDIVPDGDGYLFSIKPELLKKSHNGDYFEYEQKVVTYCREYHIGYTFEELKDSVKVIINTFNHQRVARMHKALDYIRKKGWLQPKLITHICFGN